MRYEGKELKSMKTSRRLLTFMLTLTMILSCGVCFSPAAAATEDADDENTESVSEQISLIFSKMGDMKQDDSTNTWYYSITDFDHNGRLEFFAAAQHPHNRSTNLKVWEVNSEKTDLTECSIMKDPDESFPDIITDAADTFCDKETDTWSYLFYDNIVLSPSDVYTNKCSVTMKDGEVSYTSYAVEHSELVNSYRYVTHTDSNGIAISADQYNALGTNAFAGAERSLTNFDWFTAEEADSLSRLTDSFEVFSGTKEAPEKSPVPEPPVLQHDELKPVQGKEGDPGAVYMIITKNPSSERKRPGESLKFTANANVYDSAYWTFVSPDGGEYNLEFFQAHFVYSSVSGAYGPTLTIQGIDEYMDGWGAYCTFYFKGQTAVTATAWIDIR